MKTPGTRASRKSKAAAPAVLQIDGEMTIYQAEELRQKLLRTLESPGPLCQVNLENVSEIDTAGVQLLIAARQAAGNQGKSFSITGRSAAVGEVLGIFGLTELFADPAPAA